MRELRVNRPPVGVGQTITVRLWSPWRFEHIRARERVAGRFGEGAAVFAVAFTAYLAAAAFLALHEHLLSNDAYSRTASAQRILFSHDPHLAGIGFVWSPLPVLALLPLVPFKWVWPAMTAYNFAGSLVSAVCMAGAVREITRFLADMGLGRAWRLPLAIAFAAHPLVLLYAANGMSEAMFLLFVLMATRRIAGWLRSGELHWGVSAGLALAAAYLTRYEGLVAGATAAALVAGAAAAVLVAGAGYRSIPGTTRQRLDRALCDAAFISAPIGAAFLLWLLVSWVITGNPMEQFSSTYGTGSQLAAKTTSAAEPGGWAAYAMNQVLVLEPFIAILVAGAALRAWWKGPTADIVAVLGILGAVLCFMFWSNATGTIDHELRYMIVTVPLAVLAAGTLLAPSRSSGRPTHGRLSARLPWSTYMGARALALPGRVTGLAGAACGRAAAALPRITVLGADRLDGRRWVGRLAQGAAVLAIAVALPVSVFGMTSSRLNYFDAPQIRAIYAPQGAAERQAAQRFVTERQIAADLDARALPPGSVLLDDFLGFPIPLNSGNPKQFVITSDRDFKAVLADPAASGIEYVLVPSPTDLGRLDAVNRQYPALYAGGMANASLVQEYLDLGGFSTWRLYHLNPERQT